MTHEGRRLVAGPGVTVRPVGEDVAIGLDEHVLPQISLGGSAGREQAVDLEADGDQSWLRRAGQGAPAAGVTLRVVTGVVADGASTEVLSRVMHFDGLGRLVSVGAQRRTSVTGQA